MIKTRMYWRVFISARREFWLPLGEVRSYYAIKGDSLETRRESNNANVFFNSGKSPQCLEIAIAHDFYKSIRNIDLYTEFELLTV